MNHIDELSEYYEIFKREYSSDKFFKFTTPRVASEILKSGWDSRLAVYGRICSTDKSVLITFPYEVATVIYSDELFYYIDYLKVWSEYCEHKRWSSPDGKIFYDISILPWESEFYSTKIIPADYIEEVIIYLGTPDDLTTELITLIEECREKGIKVRTEMREVTDGLAFVCACSVFNKNLSLCLPFHLVSIQNYPKNIFEYLTPLSLDFSWLVDYEHGCSHPEPNYSYSPAVIDRTYACISGKGLIVIKRDADYAASLIFRIGIKRELLKRKIMEYFDELSAIYLGKPLLEEMV